MIRKHYDKILLAIALACLLAAGAFAFFRPTVRPVTDYVDFPTLRPQNTFVVSERTTVETEIPLWPEPTAQSSGPDWVFDLFSPPEIFYHPATQQYTVIADPGPDPIPFGIQLADVRAGEYRMQLTGWITGRDGGFLIQVQDLEGNQILNVREGREYPNLEMEVRRFRVERVPIQQPGETVANVDVGTLVIHDRRADREVTLVSNERKPDWTLTAYFRSAEDPDRSFRGQEGYRFEYNGNAYQVVSIDPPTVTVERVSLTDPEDKDTRTLTPRPVIRRPREPEPNGTVPAAPRAREPAPTGFRAPPTPPPPPPPPAQPRQPPRSPDGTGLAL